MNSNLSAKLPSPLPQENVGQKVQPVSVVNGFYQFLPPNALAFFKRSYAIRPPRPLIPSVFQAPSFPRVLPIAKIEVPKQRVLIFQDIVFTAYRLSNIDPTDYVPLSPLENKRLLGFVGYSFTIGDRGIFDGNTNIGSAANSGVPTSTSGGDIPSTSGFGSTSGNSSLVPYQGSLAEGNRGFAAYGRPQQVLAAAAVFLRPPPFEVARFTVDIAGYTLNETHFDSLMKNLR